MIGFESLLTTFEESCIFEATGKVKETKITNHVQISDSHCICLSTESMKFLDAKLETALWF